MIIYGLRTRTRALGQRASECPNCHRVAMTSYAQRRRWFTLFFVPLFPISGRTSIANCGLCGYQYQVDTKQVDAEFSKPGGPAAV